MPRGGSRKGAGRPTGGRHGEKTKLMRVPLSMEDELKTFMDTKGYKVPFYSSRVSAGYPAPADNHVEDYVNLYKLFFANPKNLGITAAIGNSMINVGMFDGDPILFDIKQEPKHRDIVVALVNGEQTVKRLDIKGNKVTLFPENDGYPPISITAEMDFKISGVVRTWFRQPK